MKLVIEEGQRLLVDGEWREAGEVILVKDAYQAAVLIASDVAKAAPKK